MSVTHPRLLMALLRLPAGSRAALSHISITPSASSQESPWAQLVTSVDGVEDSFGGPLDAAVPILDQVAELRDSGLWGAVEHQLDERGAWHVQLWANDREAFRRRLDLAAEAVPLRDLLGAATDVRYARWRLMRAENAAQEAIQVAGRAGFTEEQLRELIEPLEPSDGHVSGDAAGSPSAASGSRAEDLAGSAEPVFTPRPYTDLDGMVGWSELVPPNDVAPCVVCGVRCGAVIAGIRIHPVCWEGSTAEERASTQPVGHPWERQHTSSREEALSGDASDQVAPDPGGAIAAVEEKEPDAPAEASELTPAAEVSSQSPSTGRAVLPPFQGEFRAAAAVVALDGIWLSSGERVQFPGAVPEHVGDLVRLAQWLSLGTQVTKYLDASGQIWVSDELAERMGLDVKAIAAAPEHERDKVARQVSASSPAVAAAVDQGFRFGGQETPALGRWTRVWKDSNKSVWVVLMGALNHDPAALPLMGGDPPPEQLARRLGLFAQALGHPYALSGPTTGMDLLFALRHKDRDRFFQFIEPCPPAASSTTEADISWSRPPTEEELTHEWVHAYDRSGSYLAGVSSLDLGIGKPVHHPQGRKFSKGIPGYWRVEIPESGDWRMPHPLDPRGKDVGKTRWVSTPALEFAIEQGYAPEILESWTWEEKARILDPWYERIREARTSLDVDDPDSQIARDQIKAVYAPTIGMMGSSTHMSGRPGFAPERRHMIVAKARTNILRRVHKIGQDTGRWPVAIVADTVLYTSPDPDPVSAWPGGQDWLGRALGKYKPEGSALLADQLQFLTGGTYKGKDQIVRFVPGAE